MGTLMDTTIPYDATPPAPPSVNGQEPPPDGAESPRQPDQPAGRVWRYSRQDLDRETTRYLSAATQLDVEYASAVVRKVINEPIRALAPAYGVDVAAVTRWAVDSLLRRWRRDMRLLLALFLGSLLIWWLARFGLLAGTGAVIAMVTTAWFIVSHEYWVRWYGIVVRYMMRDTFDPDSAPEPGYEWVRDRIDAVSARKRGNLVIFQGKRAFVGSGRRLSRQHVIIDVSRGRKVKNGKPRKPKRFTNADIHSALISAMKDLGLSDIKVEERLFVNGHHLKGDKDFLPNGETAPPASSVGPDLLLEASQDPTPDARTYVCVEMPGWQGQLVVTLFTRAVHAGGSLYLEWEYHVLPPLKDWFRRVDLHFGVAKPRRMWRAGLRGAKEVIPALFKAPFVLAADLVHVNAAKRRKSIAVRAIKQGQSFDYGAASSIREDAHGESRQHHFLERDEIMFVLMSQEILTREVRAFLRKHDVSLTGFDQQVEEISKSTYQFYNIHLGKVSDSIVAIGPEASAKREESDKKD
jgi:hypothetical protein